MREIIARFLAETPSFFKRLIALGLSLGVIGAALLEPHIAERLPEFVTKVAGYLVTVGLVTASIAKLTVKDPDTLKK